MSRDKDYMWLKALISIVLILCLICLKPISEYILDIKLDQSQMSLVFIGYIILVILFLVFLIFVSRFLDYLRSLKKCPHGVIGGINRKRCMICKIDAFRTAAEIKEKREGLYKIENLKKKIESDALSLKIQETKRLTQFNLRKIELLLSLTPNKFEDAVAEMYRLLGYRAKQTPYSNDKGKDIILHKDDVKYLVECKRYKSDNLVGREELQKFFAAIIEENAELGYFITTSGFRSTAKKYANDIKKIILVDGRDLSKLMKSAYPQDFGDTYKAMCKECGEIVEFNLHQNSLQTNCKNGHSVKNEMSKSDLVSEHISSNKYCKKCDAPMKVVKWGGKSFFGCTRYPSCRYTERL